MIEKQLEINVLTGIIPDRLHTLEKVLNRIQTELRGGQSMPFEKLNTIHFCRWVIIEKQVTNEKEYPERLIFAGNFDGTVCATIINNQRFDGINALNFYGQVL